MDGWSPRGSAVALKPLAGAPPPAARAAARLTQLKEQARRFSGTQVVQESDETSVQLRLWQLTHKTDYIADPGAGPGSMHSWGIAVDATLVDARNRPVRMPTDFDDFTPAAMCRYMGSSFEIGGHVRLLQYAMHKAGFWGMRTEWWHFTIAHWQKYLPPEKTKDTGQILATQWEGGL